MNPYFYTNAAGQQFPMPERPLEPPDCYMPDPEAPLEEDDEPEGDE